MFYPNLLENDSDLGCDKDDVIKQLDRIFKSIGSFVSIVFFSVL